jgi:hypothetical protein
MRSLTLIGGVFVLSACDGSVQPDQTTGKPSTAAPASEPAPPAAPKPTLGGQSDGPPAAWLETEGGSFWLGYSSYCSETVFSVGDGQKQFLPVARSADPQLPT